MKNKIELVYLESYTLIKSNQYVIEALSIFVLVGSLIGAAISTLN